MAIDARGALLALVLIVAYALGCFFIEPRMGRWLARWHRRRMWRRQARKWRQN